ncbi:hypothetical protein A2U01_0113387, partial [Trifolium medium]|nr:hypothetical protein [Trifolium medium]
HTLSSYSISCNFKFAKVSLFALLKAPIFH